MTEFEEILVPIGPNEDSKISSLEMNKIYECIRRKDRLLEDIYDHMNKIDEIDKNPSISDTFPHFLRSKELEECVIESCSDQNANLLVGYVSRQLYEVNKNA